MATASAKKLASALAALRHDPAQLEDQAGRTALLDALRSRNAALIIDAARLIAEQRPSGLEDALRAAYHELVSESPLDPGCLAKEALLAALDGLENLDAELFAQAALYVQLERSKGGARDTAARVRARGVLGIARLGHVDWLPILGLCLADPDPTLRLTAARALGHRGQRDAAGLLLLRAGVGDEVPEIVNECLRGLFATAPDFGARLARALLSSGESGRREQVLHALGTAPHDAAVALLLEQLEDQALPSERNAIIEALGLSLRPNARASLLALVSGERASDAEAALEALSIHRYDERLVTELRALTERSRPLARRFSELFGAA